MNHNGETCANCRHWRRLEDGKPLGQCRGNPPTVILIGMTSHPLMPGRQMPITDSVWPPVPEGETCGQWKVRAGGFPQISFPVELPN